MLPKKHRLPLRVEMSQLKKEGKLLQGNFFSLLYLIDQDPTAKIAFIVSKKINSKAVERNKIKRRLSEAVYPLLNKLSGIKGVFLTKKNINGVSLIEIQKEVEKIINEITN